MVQAFSGLMMMNGDEGGPPTRIGTSILDYGTGMWAAMGVLGALVGRATTGRGCVVDASLFETGLAWLKGHYASFRTSGVVPERHRTGSNRVVPFQAFETKTGPVIVAAGNDRLFVKLATVLGHPEWVTDPRFKTNAARVENRPALCKMIDEIMADAQQGRVDRSAGGRRRAVLDHQQPAGGGGASAGGGARHDPADAGRGLFAGGAADLVRWGAAEDSLGAAGCWRARQVVCCGGALARALILRAARARAGRRGAGRADMARLSP